MAIIMPKPVLRNNTWYLDVRIPSDVLGAYRIETKNKGDKVRKSLQTRDEVEAKRRFVEEYAKFQKTWARLRNTEAGNVTRLTNKQVIALSGLHYENLMRTFQDDPPVVTSTRETLAALSSIRHLKGRRGKWFGPVINDFLDREVLYVDDDSKMRLGEAFYDAAVQAIEAFERFAEGDYTDDPKGNRFPAWVSPEAHKDALSEDANGSHPAISIDSLFERWEKTHIANGKAKGTVNDFRTKVEAFKAFLGHGDAEKVTPRDVGEWVDHLLHDCPSSEFLGPEAV